MPALGRRAGEEVQRVLDPGIDVLAAVPEDVGVVGVGAHPLEAVEVEGAESDDVGAEDVEAGVHADELALEHEPAHPVRQVQRAGPPSVSGVNPALRAASS